MRVVVVLTAMMVAGCSAGIAPTKPSNDAIDRLETKLSGAPCIGPLGYWDRRYSYESSPLRPGLGHLDRWYDYRTIRFEFFEADGAFFKSGRHRYGRPNFSLYVDGKLKFASGTYNIASGKLTIDFCGPDSS